MFTTTTSTVQGCQIRKYLGIAVGEAILGANVLRNVFTGIRDLVGGGSAPYGEELRKARDVALYELTQKAQRLGADAVVDLNIGYHEISSEYGGMLMITATGTAVELTKIAPPDNLQAQAHE